MKKNLVFKCKYYILALIIMAYIISCDVTMTFSIVMNIYFFTAVILLVLLNFYDFRPINKEVRQPSFIRTFIKTATVFYFICTLALMCFNIFYPKDYLDKGKEYNYIIVFGAGIKKDSSQIINSRLETAIEYSAKYRRAKFVLTGAKGEDEPIEEAEYMRQYMLSRGVPGDKIIIDPFSVNTYENLQNSIKLIKNNEPIGGAIEPNIGLMSSEFHLTRISLMARNLGLVDSYVIPCKTNPIFVPYMYARENISLFKAFVLGQLKL